MSEWINVKDRLPENGHYVLVFWPNWSRYPVLGYINKKNNMWHSNFALSLGKKDGKQINGPTHWMPIPDPPEEYNEPS